MLHRWRVWKAHLTRDALHSELLIPLPEEADLHHWPSLLWRAWGQLSGSGGLFEELTLIRVLFVGTENPEELNISDWH